MQGGKGQASRMRHALPGGQVQPRPLSIVRYVIGNTSLHHKILCLKSSEFFLEIAHLIYNQIQLFPLQPIYSNHLSTLYTNPDATKPKQDNSPAMDKLKSAFSKDSSQSGQEPLSGEQGLGSKGEPYDAGNVGRRLSLPHSRFRNANA